MCGYVRRELRRQIQDNGGYGIFVIVGGVKFTPGKVGLDVEYREPVLDQRALALTILARANDDESCVNRNLQPASGSFLGGAFVHFEILSISVASEDDKKSGISTEVHIVMDSLSGCAIPARRPLSASF